MADLFDTINKMGGGRGSDGSDGVNASAIGVVAVIGLVVAVFLSFSAFVIVEPGTVGVVTHFGAVQDEVLPEGLHMIMPIKTKVVPVDVRVQKIEAEATASSKDLQIVTSKVALNYYLDKAKANLIFQELGANVVRNIIIPAIQESVKSGTAQFNAESLITKRPDVKTAIQEDITQRLVKYNVIVTDFSILDFAFSPEFNTAIEDKQVAEQRALRAVNDLERIKTEAAQTQAKAEGDAEARLINARAEAESQRLLRQTLNASLVQLRAIEKWDGKLPEYMGGNAPLPFIDIKGR